jgi:Photosynthesis system II assembly factor YCF48
MKQLPKILKERLGPAMQAKDHPDANLLAAFSESTLTKHERTRVLEHLASCAVCRDVVSLATPEVAAGSLLSAVARRPVWMSWSMLRWSAAAACVIIVGAAVRLHYQERISVVSTKAPQSARLVPSPPPSSESYASNARREETENKVESRTKPESRDKLELRVSPKGKRDLDAGRNVALFDQLEQKNARAAIAHTPPGASDKQMSDEVAQLKKDLPAEKISQIAAAPPPSSVTDAKAPLTQREARKDNLREYLAKSAETVTVTAEAPGIQTTESSVSKAKAAPKPAPSNEIAPAGAVGGGASVSKSGAGNQPVTLQTASLLAAANARWAVSSEGKLQRSLDRGTTWQNVPLRSDAVLQSVATVAQHVWVGGRGGALFHSTDAGEHWIELKPSLDGQALTADIIGVEFTDTLHGKLITKDQTWLTSDGGRSWRNQ